MKGFYINKKLLLPFIGILLIIILFFSTIKPNPLDLTDEQKDYLKSYKELEILSSNHFIFSNVAEVESRLSQDLGVTIKLKFSDNLTNKYFELPSGIYEDKNGQRILSSYEGDYIPDRDLSLVQLDYQNTTSLLTDSQISAELLAIAFKTYKKDGSIDRWIDQSNNVLLESFSSEIKPELRIGVENLPCIAYIDNKNIYGLSIAFLNKFGAITNTQIQYITGEYDKLNEMLEKNELDLIISTKQSTNAYEIFREPLFIVSSHDLNIYESWTREYEEGNLDNISVEGKYYRIPESLYILANTKLDTPRLYINHFSNEDKIYYFNGNKSIIEALSEFDQYIFQERLMDLSYYNIPNENDNNMIKLSIIILVGILATALLVIVGVRMLMSYNEKQRLNYLFKHDQLTYLPNSYGLSQIYEGLKKDDGIFILIDFRRFKLINDLYGTDVGDQILIEFAGLLSSIDHLSVGRTGGNQFTCIYNKENYQELLANIATTLSNFKTDKIEGRHLNFSLCYVNYPKYGEDYNLLIKNLESTLYHAKANNIIDEWIEFSDDIYNSYLVEQELAIEIQNALENEDFQLFYQPQTELYHEKTIGAEVLIRWTHKTRGPIYPDQFLGVAERNGLMRKLDMYMIKKACDQIKIWQDQQLNKMKISVNMSTYTFESHDMSSELLQIIEDSHIDTSWFALEITEESGFTNIKEANKVMSAIKLHGIRFALDDFGKGYSSISYLEQLPFDFLKIDKAFIDHIHTQKKSRDLYHLITSLAKLYDMHIIAEGVEYEEQLNVIKDDLSTIVQGYYYSKPLPLEDFELRIKKQNNL